ncbi:MAG: hypothetical protein ACTSYY_04405 [Promethearchaeota archaeon]
MKEILVPRTSIKLWNLYDDNVIAYFTKRFCSYLSEMGLSCRPIYPKHNIQVIDRQSTKPSSFNIFITENQSKIMNDRYLNFDLKHLLFFDITDKEKEYKMLNEFNEIPKIKKTNLSFIIILYDSTNESGHFQPPKSCSISIPSYPHLIITEQKHFDVQGFYEWLYKIIDRSSKRVIRYNI